MRRIPAATLETAPLLLTAGLLLVVLTGLGIAPASRAELPPVPVPPENPITESKRVLGKILFWDEQLSSDDTVACGTCHATGAGGADLRRGTHPGLDGVFGTGDDVTGSPGVVHRDAAGDPTFDAQFGFEVQVTGRAANPFIVAAWFDELFWDGRAGTTFLDPETGAVSIAVGGALENQAVGPILSSVEMAKEGRTWDDVRDKLEQVPPLQWATRVPPDMAAALVASPTYPDLFAAAFGDPAITAERIAQAIATYERTLVPDDTPWDRLQAGDTDALSASEQAGWNFFQGSACAVCHAPPLFSDGSFRNIGVRPVAEDRGRQDVTGLAVSAGRFKVPSLRNVGLKNTFMHNGGLRRVRGAVDFYLPGNADRSVDNLDPLLPVLVPAGTRADLTAFLTTGLRDARVANEEFPFDRPRLLGGPTGFRACNDEVDNDGDGQIDLGDDGCANGNDESEEIDCSDGVDNDEDGSIDFPADVSCASADSGSEVTQCSDGIDNDGDGRVDFDGAGAADPDPQCAGGPSRDTESATVTRCGLGFELVLALSGLIAWRRRYS